MEERSVIEELRARKPPARLLRGFAPLLLALLLAFLMVLTVPSVAPEEIVRTPVTEEAGE